MIRQDTQAVCSVTSATIVNFALLLKSISILLLNKACFWGIKQFGHAFTISVVCVVLVMLLFILAWMARERVSGAFVAAWNAFKRRGCRLDVKAQEELLDSGGRTACGRAQGGDVLERNGEQQA